MDEESERMELVKVRILYAYLIIFYMGNCGETHVEKVMHECVNNKLYKLVPLSLWAKS